MDFVKVAGVWLDRCAGWLVDVAAAMLVLMLVLINVEITGRYFLNYSTMISDEYSGYLFTWMTMLCLLRAQRSGRLLQVEAVVTRVPPRVRAAFDLFSALIGVAVTAVLANATWHVVSLSWRFGAVSLEASNTLMYLPQSVMPVGFALLAVGYATFACESWARLINPVADALPAHHQSSEIPL